MNKKLSISICLFALSIAASTGCNKSPEPQFRINAVEKMSAERINLGDGETISDENMNMVGNILTALFGTPNQPKFPLIFGENDPAAEILSLENLRIAAGPVSSDRDDNHTGLYREHCAHCHGISGDGAGPTARTLNPYPRDFRLGKFKFKSTPLGNRPTDDDLNRILVNGIPGTGMPSFRNLPPEQLAALVDYVKYLSIRGEAERLLLSQASKLDQDEELLDLSMADDEATLEDFEDAMADAIDGDEGCLSRVLPKWIKRDRHVSKLSPAPASFDLNHADHKMLVERGKELFHSTGGCVQCHGETGLGDGQTESFDDWTAWAKEANIDLRERASYAPYVAAGALPPRFVRPRNLNMKVFRGGNHPDDIYRRINNGIEGTPMPSTVTLEKTPDDIWALVAYVKSIPYEKENLTEKPVNNKPIN